MGIDLNKYKSAGKGKFLRKEDLGDKFTTVTYTIDKLQEFNVAKQDDPEELKLAVIFVETEKPLVLNFTKLDFLEAYLGKDTDAWAGKQVKVMHDPSITFGSKIVGGITLGPL